MNLFRTLIDAISARPTPEVQHVHQAGGQPRVCELVNPDGCLVSDRGAIRVWRLDPPGAPLPSDGVLYITRDYPAMHFRFTLVRCADGSYRAYIRAQPEYGDRSADLNSTHRLSDGRNGFYVCWAPAPRDAQRMLKVARLWAERTARYIATGQRLEAP